MSRKTSSLADFSHNSADQHDEYADDDFEKDEDKIRKKVHKQDSSEVIITREQIEALADEVERMQRVS